ncbi:MAG: ECF transporter S component [Clostridia bacterium]|nr:ECF transporter S component [Clostridia bacterium]
MNLRKIVTLAMLTALGFVFILLIHFPIFPAAPYLVYDAGDIPIIIGSFLYGPLSGIIITAILSLLQMLFLSTDGIIGFLMHVIATGTLVLVSGSIYKKNKTRKNAIIGLLLGSLGMVLIMLPVNYIIQVFVYGTPSQVILPILPIIAAFNAIKALVNSFIVFLVYKPLSRFVKNGKEV